MGYCSILCPWNSWGRKSRPGWPTFGPTGHPGDSHLVPLGWAGICVGDATQGAEAEGPREESKSVAHDRRQYFPHKVLLVRGTARLETVDGIVPEYALAAERYFGAEQAQAWLKQVRTILSIMVRITVTPEWVGLLDFQDSFSERPVVLKILL